MTTLADLIAAGKPIRGQWCRHKGTGYEGNCISRHPSVDFKRVRIAIESPRNDGADEFWGCPEEFEVCAGGEKIILYPPTGELMRVGEWRGTCGKDGAFSLEPLLPAPIVSALEQQELDLHKRIDNIYTTWRDKLAETNRRLNKLEERIKAAEEEEKGR